VRSRRQRFTPPPESRSGPLGAQRLRADRLGTVLLHVSLLVAACGSVDRRDAPAPAGLRRLDGPARPVERGPLPLRARPPDRARTSFRVLNNLAVAYEANGRFDEAWRPTAGRSRSIRPTAICAATTLVSSSSTRASGPRRPARWTPAPAALPPRRRPRSPSASQPLRARGGERAGRGSRRGTRSGARKGSRTMKIALVARSCGPASPRSRWSSSCSRAPLAAAVEVRLKLPQRARLDLAGRKTIAIAPFLIVTQEGEDRFRGRNIDVQAEFERYLTEDAAPRDRPQGARLAGRRVPDLRPRPARPGAALLAGGRRAHAGGPAARRRPRLRHPGPLRLPHRGVHCRRTTGGRYYRQVLVEQTGFEYDILLQVYDGKTGELSTPTTSRTSRASRARAPIPCAACSRTSTRWKDRIVGVFAQKEVEATRMLFGP
jgi:hypothetical protein